MATATKNEKVRFEADGTGLKVILKSQDEKFGENGMKQAVPGTGSYVNFTPDGRGGQFYETDDQDVIETLRKKIEQDPKFFEVPIPVPSSSPVLGQIVGLAARGDTDGLVELAKAEEETHNREDVLNAIADALENMRGDG